MEFWGVEVKAGQPVKCNAAVEGKLLHLSQASLGEVKKDKGSDTVPIFVKVGNQKLVIGTLSPEKIPQIQFDLVFEKEFELSHNWKQGSVYFCGYYTSIFDNPEASSEELSESEGDDDLLALAQQNGTTEVKDEKAKPAGNKAIASKPETADKAKANVAEPKRPKDEDSDVDDSDDDDDDDDSSDEEESGDDEDILDAGDSDDEDEVSDDDDSEEDEATPKKAETGKKRPAESAKKTPVADKKVKLATPSGQKSDGKKGGAATPQPSKQAGKGPDKDRPKQQTPKSASQLKCNSCSKTFNSSQGLESHTKAKHTGGK